MTSRSDSESSASPMVVDPLRSEKTIVTIFRTSWGGATGGSGVPQKPQRRNLAEFSSPHEGHVTMGRVYAGFAGVFYAARRASRRRGVALGRPRWRYVDQLQRVAARNSSRRGSDTGERLTLCATVGTPMRLRACLSVSAAS